MTPQQTNRDKWVELVHIAVLLGGLLIILDVTVRHLGPTTPLLYPLVVGCVWTLGYYGFVKLLPRSLSGQV